MGLHTASRLDRLVIGAEAKVLKGGQLNIGPRLMIGFAVVILSMLAADAVALWQFRLLRAQAERLNGIDQKLVAVLRLHTSLTTFHDRLEDLADAQDIGRLVTEGERLRTAVLEDSRRAINAFSLAPFDFQRDPTILPILYAVQSALPAQLEAITTLANAGDWRAVRQRLANQVTAMQSVTLALVERVDHEVGEEQAQTGRKIKHVQRLVFLVVPLTAVFTLLIAGTFGLAITRSITQPLARLVEGSKALARGDFQHQVPVTGRDELADLGRVFNDTARRLQDLYATLQQSEDRPGSSSTLFLRMSGARGLTALLISSIDGGSKLQAWPWRINWRGTCASCYIQMTWRGTSTSGTQPSLPGSRWRAKCGYGRRTGNIVGG
jgi:methyl-accepting chemotaxis protein